MVLSLIIISLALAWLGYESDWMTIRLPYGSLELYDELPYDPGYLDDLFAETIDNADEWPWHHTEAEYQAYLKNLYKPKYMPVVDRVVDYPQYKIQDTIEDLAKRRAVEMIYQR